MIQMTAKDFRPDVSDFIYRALLGSWKTSREMKSHDE